MRTVISARLVPVVVIGALRRSPSICLAIATDVISDAVVADVVVVVVAVVVEVIVYGFPVVIIQVVVVTCATVTIDAAATLEELVVALTRFVKGAGGRAF